MLIEEELVIPQLSGAARRRLFIWLPEERKPGERFPVLYMFDGHNVFLDETATYGKSWGMADYLKRHPLPLIVVGIECNHQGTRRLDEYSPFDGRMRHFGEIHGQGQLTMEWLTKTLKPAIDAACPTLPDRQHTAIAGSSMGGLMALYAVTTYNEVFSRAAALSPSVWFCRHELIEEIEGASILPDTLVYMDYGTRELGNHARMQRSLLRVAETLLDKRIALCFRLVPGGTHSESSWEKQIPLFLRHLGLQ